jgi:hypothetical protein
MERADQVARSDDRAGSVQIEVVGRMIVLRPTDMCWNPAMEDDPTDQCSHGNVEFTIDSIPFVTGEDGEDITVSAAALFLLRTLTHDHTAATPVAEDAQLFPHCGFTALAVSGRFPVLVVGCNVGVDLDVVHTDGLVTIRSRDGKEATVTEAEWRVAVLGFVDEVQTFYDASPPREPFDDATADEGWTAFWQEWGGRRAATQEQRSS